MKDRIMIKDEKCLKCAHLCEDFCDTKYTCLSDPMCPAKHIAIIDSLDIDKYAGRIARAIRTCDEKKVKRLRRKMRRFDKVVQQHVNDTVTKILDKE